MTGKTVPAGAGLLLAARASYGTLLLAAPSRMIALGCGHPASPRAAAVARLLGIRHLLQAALTTPALARTTPPDAPGVVPPGVPRPGTVLLAGAAIDAVHAASMAGLAALSPPSRRAVAFDIVTEAGLAAFGIITARRLSAHLAP